jgi:hypothetical protein
MRNKSNFRHVRLPRKIDRILYILSEELRNNKFFNGIEKIGFDGTNARSHFTFLILDLVFKESSDELADRYFELLEKYTKKLKDDQWTTITKQAFRFYVDLIIEKRKRMT